MSEPASHDDVRRYNLGRILRHVHLHGSTSRSELGSLLRLNRSTVADLAASLAALGLVEEETGARGTVGRPSLVVRPVPQAACVLAYRLGVTGMGASLVGLGGQVLARRESDVDHRSPLQARDEIVRLAGELLADVDNAVIVVGVGIAVPGTVDADRSTVRRAPNLGWTDVDLGELVRPGLDELVGSDPCIVVGNDANLGALAERLRGAAVGAQHVVFLAAEVGIGAGIIVDGRLLAGATGIAGEAGHMTVEPGGRLCSCGARGCWETTIGRDSILAAAGRPPGDASFDELLRDANAGDASARAAVDEAARWLSIGLRNLVALVNPEVVILSGHLADLLPFLAVDESGFGQRVRFVAPGLGIDAPLVGSAELAFGELLADPTGAGR